VYYFIPRLKLYIGHHILKEEPHIITPATTKKVAKGSHSRKWIEWLIKLVIVSALAWVIYKQIFSRENIDELWATFLASMKGQSMGWLIGAILLIPVNWAFETLKWQILIRDFEKMAFGEMYKAILAGVTFSVFTPNRVGEYAGRVLFVKPENNWKAVVATLVGSFSQILVLLAAGLLGFIYFIYNYLDLEIYLLEGIVFIGLALILLMTFCFYNIDLVVPIAKRLPMADYLRKYVKHVNVLRNYSSRALSEVVGLSFLRYSIYSIQYFLMLMFFGIDVNFGTGLACIATIFLLQTAVPLPPLMGLFMRGEVALFVWGYFCSNDLSILASTFSLWVINMIFPALLGAIFIVNINVLKSLGYEDKSV